MRRSFSISAPVCIFSFDVTADALDVGPNIVNVALRGEISIEHVDPGVGKPFGLLG